MSSSEAGKSIPPKEQQRRKDVRSVLNARYNLGDPQTMNDSFSTISALEGNLVNVAAIEADVAKEQEATRFSGISTLIGQFRVEKIGRPIIGLDPDKVKETHLGHILRVAKETGDSHILALNGKVYVTQPVNEQGLEEYKARMEKNEPIFIENVTEIHLEDTNKLTEAGDKRFITAFKSQGVNIVLSSEKTEDHANLEVGVRIALTTVAEIRLDNAAEAEKRAAAEPIEMEAVSEYLLLEAMFQQDTVDPQRRINKDK